MTATKNVDICGDCIPENAVEEACLETDLSSNSEDDASPLSSPVQTVMDETGDAKSFYRNPSVDCSNANCRCCTKAAIRTAKNDEPFDHLLNESFEETPLFTSVVTIIGYGVLVVFGYFRDWLRRYGFEAIYSAKEPNRGPGKWCAAKCVRVYRRTAAKSVK